MKKKRSPEILIEKGYLVLDRKCSKCGILINEKNGYTQNINHKKKTFIYQCVCNKCCGKKKLVEKIPFPKEYSHALRKIVGVKDYENDKGKPCIEGYKWTKLRWC